MKLADIVYRLELPESTYGAKIAIIAYPHPQGGECNWPALSQKLIQRDVRYSLSLRHSPWWGSGVSGATEENPVKRRDSKLA
jgi:hypothetical protein